MNICSLIPGSALPPLIFIHAPAAQHICDKSSFTASRSVVILGSSIHATLRSLTCARALPLEELKGGAIPSTRAPSERA